ncbi:MAG: hypothetical protein KBF45_15960 [Cyclobacteriaceae bacterium]|jgi:hypothetical protein|nr:hypothetical protein [Cyclobacteriaceae bacterium]
MKTKLLLLIITSVFISCDIMVVEPVYDSRDRVIGTYQIEEYSQTYNDNVRYNVYIRKGFGYRSESVIIENFYNADVDVIAEIVGDKIFISRQIVQGYEIEGVGTLYYDEIRFTYRVRDNYYNKPTDFCEATAWLY